MDAAFKMNTQNIHGLLLFDEPMSKHTSWRAGGNAKQFFMAENIEGLSTFLQSLPEHEELFWLGLGSNTLVRDGGFNGTVIAMQGVATNIQLKDKQLVAVDASVTCAKLAKFCAKNQLIGGDFFAGIPGLVGGALAMNAGAFGGETWRHVVSVKTLSKQGVIRERQADEFEVAYRSVKGVNDEWFISAVLKFDLSEISDDRKGIKQLLEKRAKSQPIGLHSCGSVFKNPDGKYAAELIEECGLKGKVIGGAVVSEKHANFILNTGAATADDIENLIHFIQKQVLEKFNVELVTEVKIIGDRKK